MASMIDWLSYSVLTLVLIRLVHLFLAKGFGAVMKEVASFLLLIPGCESLVKVFTRKEIDSFMKDTFQSDTGVAEERRLVPIPEKGY